MKKINRILFLNPPDPTLVKSAKDPGYAYFEPPLGLMYTYSYLKDTQKYDTYFVDLNIEMKFIIKKDLHDTLQYFIDLYKPDLAAISALYYTSIRTFHLIAKIIKQISPETLVVLGGHYPTHITNHALEDSNIDYAVLSEGELGLAGLVDAINSSRDISNIEGIAYMKDGKLIKNDRKTFWIGFENSRRLPWEDVQMNYYFKEGRHCLNRVYGRDKIKLGAVTSTRGCPNRCAFCSSPRFFKQVWRHRRMDLIAEEINFLKDNYGVNTIIFNDENITGNRKWLVNFLDELKKLDIKWISGGGLSTRTINSEELIKKMYESGISLFNIAVESGCNETLKKIRKPLSTDEVKSVIRLIRKCGDGFIIGFFITGFPFETKTEVLKTLEFADSLDLDWRSFYSFQPFPGTELNDYCVENKLMTEYNAIDYVELHTTPNIKYIDYTADELNKLNYLYNIKCNFLKNRNLIQGTKESLAQAERDYNYILEIVPGHFFAHFCLAEIMKKRNDANKIKVHLQKAKYILENDRTFDWSYYISELGINRDDLFS